jgi:hypothetical protein
MAQKAIPSGGYADRKVGVMMRRRARVKPRLTPAARAAALARPDSVAV